VEIPCSMKFVSGITFRLTTGDLKSSSISESICRCRRPLLLMGKWWNWWVGLPLDTAQNWPKCLKGDGGATDNQSIVFLGTGAFAQDTNVNAKNQKCVISADQLLVFDSISRRMFYIAKTWRRRISG
jgi:hypothetical protein